MFKQASKLKLRFDTKKGQITTEDLWDLPLTSRTGVSLDAIAIAVNNELQASKETSFVAEKSDGDSILELKLEILKAVIADRKAENAAKRDEAEKKERKDKIARILENKKDEELAGKSVEELEAMLKE